MSHCLFVIDSSASMERARGLTIAESVLGETCQLLRAQSSAARLYCSAIVGGLSTASHSGLFPLISKFCDHANLFQRLRTSPAAPTDVDAFAACGNMLSLFYARNNLERLAIVFLTDGLLPQQTTAGIRRISWAISGHGTEGLVINYGDAELPKCFERIAKATWTPTFQDRDELPLRLAGWIHDCLFRNAEPRGESSTPH